MKSNLLCCLLLISFLFSCQTDKPDTAIDAEPPTESTLEEMPKEISFATADEVQIIGDLYEQDKTAPTILLFHQAGSNARAEYGLISPRLFARGYNILAIDQHKVDSYMEVITVRWRQWPTLDMDIVKPILI